MALTSWSTANHLRVLTAPITAEPLGISVWANTPDTAVAQIAAALGTDQSGDNCRAAIKTSSDTAAALARDTGNGNAQSVAMTPDTWQHIMACFVSSTSREAELDGANLGTNTVSVSPSAPDSVYIGILPDQSGFPWDSSGGLAEISLWNLSGFTAQDRRDLTDKLASGYSPLVLDAQTGEAWAGALVSYWPLPSTSDLTDYAGANDLSAVGTLSNFASHPPMIGASGLVNGGLINGGLINSGLVRRSMEKINGIWQRPTRILVPVGIQLQGT